MYEKILFVDDDANILAGYKRQLRTQFSVETATSGQQGIETLALQGPFAVVVADYRMPGIDGNQFLIKAKEVSPDTVRMMLTGHAELGQAIDAVNEGHIFRFLTKPCPPESLAKALQAGMEQYRLIISERELLEKTLSNSIRLLTEVLSLANPVAFSQMLSIRKITRRITSNLKLYDAWQYELAAMLSQIGCIALPPKILEKAHTGEPLSKSEESIYASHPMIGYKLLVTIPRLEAVPMMVRDQQKLFADYADKNLPNDVKFPLRDQKAELGAQIIKVATDYENLVHRGMPHQEIIKMMLDYSRMFNPVVVQALGDAEIPQDEYVVKMVNVEQAEVGMIANEAIISKNGEIFIAKDQEIYPLILERLQLAGKTGNVIEPFRVLAPKGPKH